MRIFVLSALLWSAPAFAGGLPEDVLNAASGVPVVIAGEMHDNPAHHAAQAGLVAHLQPRAIVFEMLTEAQAAAVTPENRATQSELDAAIGWSDSGWPDFAMYYPIFAAAPEAAIHGAGVPRDAARAAMQAGIAESFGPEAAAYGLSDPLPQDQQEAREAMQLAAHCNAMPAEMLPVMVDLQRLRDAVLARETLRALDATGGPVVVITGNGHARRDWGVPATIALLRPDLEVLSIAQDEDGSGIAGGFDLLLPGPSVERPDPCEGFRQAG